jgi:hypothetical protein
VQKFVETEKALSLSVEVRFNVGSLESGHTREIQKILKIDYV